MTPKKAIELGADYLVIGRPITESNNIKESLSRIIESLK
jgi:orotidine-5'-phosphate decarboxylase